LNSNVPNGSGGPALAVGSGAKTRFGELASDALRYWEPRRLLYNLALFAVVIAHFYVSWPNSKAFITQNTFYGFFFLAVLANIAYCASYAVDLFVQFAGLSETWSRWRWSLLVIGIIFAAVISHFFMLGILSSESSN
jgi:hypothetical protein